MEQIIEQFWISVAIVTAVVAVIAYLLGFLHGGEHVMKEMNTILKERNK